MCPAALIAAGYAALLVSWAMANPPFAAPDEWAHYLRALSLGRGQLIGRSVADVPPAGVTGEERLRLVFQGSTQRLVDVPGGLSSVGFACNATRPTVSAACLHGLRSDPRPGAVADPVGAYQPVAYLLPGLAMRLGHDPPDTDRWGRMASAATALALLGLALALAWDAAAGIVSLLGVLTAVTPMVLFIDATITPSGLEATAAIVLVVALLRLGRDETPTRWRFAPIAVTGALLALARSPSVVWVVVDIALAAALVGPARLVRRVREGGWRGRAAVAVVVIGVLGNRLWEEAYGAPTPTGWPSGVGHSLVGLVDLFKQEVGDFGSLDSPQPTLDYAIWLAVLGLLVVLALRVGSRREQWAVAGAVVVAGAVLPILLNTVVLAPTGFGIQGRHVLAIVVAIPLLAGEVVRRHRTGLGASPLRLLRAVPTAVALVQLVAFYANARRQAVGVDGSFWFLRHATWSPPLGWGAWLLVALAGAVLIGQAAWTARPPRRS